MHTYTFDKSALEDCANSKNHLTQLESNHTMRVKQARKSWNSSYMKGIYVLKIQSHATFYFGCRHFSTVFFHATHHKNKNENPVFYIRSFIHFIFRVCGLQVSMNCFYLIFVQSSTTEIFIRRAQNTVVECKRERKWALYICIHIELQNVLIFIFEE